MNIIVTAALGAVLLTGCTAGTKVDRQTAAGFQEGVTRCDDIVRALGKPWRTDRSAIPSAGLLDAAGAAGFAETSGRVTRLHYDYAVATPTPQSAIPVVGLFVAGSNIHSTRHDFICNPDGVMTRHTTEEIDSFHAEGIANRK